MMLLRMESLPPACRTRELTEQARFPVSRIKRVRAFTLIELVIVLLIITITIGLVGINLYRSNNHYVRDEADRVVILLQAAREEAILQGQVYAVQFTRDGYSFQRLNTKGKLEPIETDDVLTPRVLPEGITLSFEMDGVEAKTGDILLLEPSGAFDPFVITLRAGQAVWQALGLANGKMQSKQPA